MKKYEIFMDGNLWCAVNDEFTNIQESPAGFGLTTEVALSELIMQENDNKIFKIDGRSKGMNY